MMYLLFSHASLWPVRCWVLMYLLFNFHFVIYLLCFIKNRQMLIALLFEICYSFYPFMTMRVLIHCFYHFLAEIFSSRKVHIWTRCEITGADNYSYCCSCCSFLCLCCQKTDGCIFWPLGDIHNGCCCCVHSLCESFSLVYKVYFFFSVCSTVLVIFHD